MILVGVVTGILSGVALPGHILLFGEVINQFVYFSIASGDIHQRVTAFVENETLNTVNLTVDDILCDRSVASSTLASFASNGSGEVYFCSQGEGSDVFESILDYVCDPRGELTGSVAVYSYYYLTIGVGVLMATFLSNCLWNLSAYRQTRRMRLAFYRSVLSQEIGWFDVTESAELSTRLAE